MYKKRFIVVASSEEKQSIVFVVSARSLFSATTLATRRGLKYNDYIIKSVRELYNPMYNFKTAFMFVEKPVPPKFIEKYKFWDNNEVGINFFVL